MSLHRSHLAALSCAITVMGFALSWTGAATGVTPSVLPAPQVKVSKAEADLCPTPAVARALADQGVMLGARSPAVMAYVDGRQCVRLPMTQGGFALDLSAGSVPAEGGITFKKSTGRTLTFTDVVFDFGTRRADGTATIEGAGAGRARQQSVTLFTLEFQLDKTRVDLTRGTAEGAAALGIGQGGDSALKDAFGTSPLPAQGTVFDASAGGDVTQAAQALSRALLP
ncbi:hypothetical protein LE181_04425 [Streptomyces sp. SCA3-4]|uniref:hypothetical protein n=1 Tax=Streptomyces sichuanensis TaxID=2871810 RepID=UPI001CE299C5|nr:hypothetical protein [Streptomyces sichuanensis]MCA6091416.1 hypothetical protein [Streptomyces sichuanensis]